MAEKNEFEPRWHAAIGVALALGLYVTLPNRLTFGPVWFLPLIILVTLVPLMIVSPHRNSEARWQRAISIAHIALLNLFNLASIVYLLGILVGAKAHRPLSGEQLLYSSLQLWFTNVLVYALWFWEIDGGGPNARVRSWNRPDRRSDFLFPQMALNPDLQKNLKFCPKFFDYFFVSFTFATAFSPCDTFPITWPSKFLMVCEALTSLVTLAVFAARAVNILS